jgi:hypothetical protein
VQLGPVNVSVIGLARGIANRVIAAINSAGSTTTTEQIESLAMALVALDTSDQLYLTNDVCPLNPSQNILALAPDTIVSSTTLKRTLFHISTMPTFFYNDLASEDA